MTADPPPAPHETAEPFPTHGRLLGVDHGTKRLGLAVSNVEQTIASPLLNYERGDLQAEERRFVQVVREYEIRGLIVGLPVHHSGDEGGQAHAARRFGDRLAALVRLPIRYWDERFSSTLADDVLHEAEFTKKQRKGRRDMLAARILLQSYLDAEDKTRKPLDFGGRTK